MYRLRPADWAGLGCGLVGFAAYFACACPTVGPGDSAELTVTVLKLGIAHPPGYPLFLWLGRIATLLPASPAVAANLLGVLLAAAGVTAVYFAARTLGAGVPGSAAAALLFGFGPTFWQNATSIEVYGLSTLLLGLAVVLAARARTETRLHPAAAYVAGLAIANQPSALLWLPALFLLGFSRDRRPRGRAVLLSVGAFVLGLTSSLGTLVRALARPEVNWGNPSTLGRFLAHATARQYGDLAGAAAPLPRLAEMPRVLSSELGIAGLSLVVLGLLGLVLSSRRTLVALLLLAAGGAFGLTYAVPDFRVQLLPTMAALCLAAGTGVDALAVRLGRLRPVSYAALVAPALLLATGLGPARESRTFAVADLGSNLLKSLPPNAVLVAGGDVPANAARYCQTRLPDEDKVGIIDAEMLFSPTYVEALSARLGIENLPGFDALVRAAGIGLRRQRLQGALAALATAVAPVQPVALTGELLTPEFFSGPIASAYQVVPRGIVYELTPRTDSVGLDSLLALNDSLWRGISVSSVRREFTRQEFRDVQLTYASARNNLGMFCLERNRPDAALRLLQSALEFPAPVQFRSVLVANVERARSALVRRQD
jgi:hypothetical protein